MTKAEQNQSSVSSRASGVLPANEHTYGIHLHYFNRRFEAARNAFA